MNKALVTAVAIAAVFIFVHMCFATDVMKGSESKGAIVSIEPSCQRVSSGETFTVDIYVEPKGNEIVGADFILCFNNTLLNATSLVNGTFFSGFDTNDTMGKGIDNTNGTIDYCEYVWPYTGTGVTTNGTLTTITFQASGEDGVADFFFKKLTLSNTTGYRILNVTVINGTVEITEASSIFDTGAPQNPYPGIMGEHNGTIIPDQRIEVNTIYTYSCPGTGGHTEFVRLWGPDVDTTATWAGYVDDWHNLTFDNTFTLEPGVEYNYTIRTGSYPQIIHVQSGDYKEVTGGKLKCTKFVDANGRRNTNTNWIPAFRLWKGGD